MLASEDLQLDQLADAQSGELSGLLLKSRLYNLKHRVAARGGLESNLTDEEVGDCLKKALIALQTSVSDPRQQQNLVS